MVVEVAEACSAGCGVRVAGQLDTDTREFFYRFTLPRGAENLLKSRSTEVERTRLVTLSPRDETWSVECPVCRGAIRIMTRNP